MGKLLLILGGLFVLSGPALAKIATFPTMVQIYTHDDDTLGAKPGLVVLVKTADGKPVDPRRGLEEGDQIDLLQCDFRFDPTMTNAEYVGTDVGGGKGGCVHQGTSVIFQSMDYRHIDVVVSDQSYDPNSSAYGAITVFRIASVGNTQIKVSRVKLTSLAAPDAYFQIDRYDHVYRRVADGEIPFARLTSKWGNSTQETSRAVATEEPEF